MDWAQTLMAWKRKSRSTVPELSLIHIYEAGCELFRKRIECAIMMKVAEDSANS